MEKLLLKPTMIITTVKTPTLHVFDTAVAKGSVEQTDLRWHGKKQI